MKHFPFRQSIPNLERTIIWQTYDITSPSLINSSLTLSHKLRRAGETHELSMTDMVIRSITKELA